MSVPYSRIRTGQLSRTPIACALCGVVTGDPLIDHCHDHGFTRGLVCASCNARMGYVDQSPETATKAEAFHRDNCPDCRRISGGVPPTPAPDVRGYMPKPPRKRVQKGQEEDRTPVFMPWGGQSSRSRPGQAVRPVPDVPGRFVPTQIPSVPDRSAVPGLYL